MKKTKQKSYLKGIALALFLVVFTPCFLLAQRTVTGKVISEDGTPLTNASVQLKNGSIGTLSANDGTFTIAVPTGETTLVVSFIGFISQDVDIAGESQVIVVLESESTSLQDVVVVGYGTQRAEAVTGSVSSIQGDALREVPAANISQALQGRLPGVELSQTSSQPGAAMQIRIRGSRSLSASNDPLIVLDGIPFAGSIGDINSNDIKSIDILKDASATAIYGSRGANGVIIVTTNKGQIGQKAKFSYNSYVGTKDLFAKFPMMNGSEFAALRKAAGQYTNSLDESDDTNTDWQDLLYRTGMTTSHDFGVSGGTEKGTYYFNAGYFEDQGVIPTQGYKRYSIRGSIDQGIGEYFRVGFTTNSNFNVTQGSNVGIYGALSMSPIANPYNEDGSWKRTIRMPLDETWSYSRDIVNSLKDEWLSQNRAYGTYNTLYGEVKIPGVEGLKYRANLGLNYRQANGGSYTGTGINSSNPETVSTASISNAMTTDWTIENLVTYDRTFAEKHDFNVVALYSASENRFNDSRISAKDIPADAFQFYNLGQAAGEITVNPNEQNYRVSGLMSWMGRVMYSYDNRYMISATLRSDGSSRLAKGHQWHTYPAVSAGWNISNESFMQDVSFINMLKLRAGYGQTSNQSVAPYATLGRLSTRPYNFGDEYSTGYYVTELPNADLGWEYSETFNYGVDFALLNNRLSGTIEYYTTNTKDLLLGVNLPSTSGVGSYTANVGQTRNKGLELSLNGVIVDNNNGWTWEAGFNLYANRNELVALASGATRDEGNWWFVGHPIDVVYDYQKVGLWQEGDPYLSTLEPGGNVGMIKVKYTGEYAEDGTPLRSIGADDRQIMSIEPKFQGGLNTRVSYKGFDLSAIGSFKSGGTLISTLYSSAGYLNMMSGRRNNVKIDYWTPENTDATYPKPGGITSSDNPKYGSTLGYFDASYLKIRTLSLGYNFDNNNWLKDIGVSRLRVYLTAQNPFVLFSPYKKESGMDPETNSYGNENAAVAYSQNLRRLLTIGTNAPATRSYLVGINLTF
ncbi:SusC/RagA family TonB-linked outer membrane protein [Albibacterium bauzanense]|uniref:TonB-linked SusC/RagA family outer membrane protein n=1 Tax=Albibacterium bauzanense TaxID=653929 RepID=A0A4R1M6N0_9SPHI|nr:TonB-dependent receptor [Albibacterium bauzanense]TCK85409.1 TonB-linked SusC/RagA family outer membrane protein [Albibacterium bauzanense]